MYVDVDWLRSYCDVDLETRALADRLTMAGLNVEEVFESPDGRTVLDLEITANRPDCNSYRGVARELSALTGQPTECPGPDVAAREVESWENTNITIHEDARDLCPRYVGRIVRDLDVKPSPDWLRERLRSMDMEPVNNIVDITNFVLFETGQPLHAFDLDALRNRSIQVRTAREGEEIHTIQNSTHELNTDELVIADAERPVAIAGVIGGSDTEVDASTGDVLIESALFDPVRVRRTARRLGISTESSYRFERGPDPNMVEPASRRAAELMEELAGGHVEETYIDRDDRDAPEQPRSVPLRHERMERILGCELDPRRSRNILESLGFKPREEDKSSPTHYSVPSWRPDVDREVDLIEEVARIYGYDQLPETPGARQTLAEPTRDDRVRDRLRTFLTGAGLTEICTFSFLTDEDRDLPTWWETGEAVGILDANHEVDRHLRRSLIPSFLDVVKTNHGYGKSDLALFEMASIFGKNEDIDEREVVGLLVEDDFFRLKGIVEDLVDRHLPEDVDLRVEQGDHELFSGGPSARLFLDHQFLGQMGEVAPSYLEPFSVSGSFMVAELDYERLRKQFVLEKTYRTFSRFPPSRKDLAFLVNRDIPWRQLREIIEAGGPEVLRDIQLFDVFEGGDIPDQKKSVAVRLVFRSTERTLETEEINEWLRDIVGHVEAELPAELRGDL